MNTDKLAQALNTIAMGFAEAAEAISTGAPVSAPRPAAGAVSPPAPAGTFSDGTPIDEPDLADIDALVNEVARHSTALPPRQEPTGDQGSEAVCPKHRVPYHPSKNPTWQPYCPEKSDGEPNWTNKNGYCSITPKSAVAWLRQHAGAAA